MNVTFNGIVKELGDHVCDLREHVSNEVILIWRRFGEVAKQIGALRVNDDYCGFGHAEGGKDMSLCHDYNDILMLNTTGKEHQIDTAEVKFDNVD